MTACDRCGQPAEHTEIRNIVARCNGGETPTYLWGGSAVGAKRLDLCGNCLAALKKVIFDCLQPLPKSILFGNPLGSLGTTKEAGGT